jgi:hypothetical protein
MNTITINYTFEIAFEIEGYNGYVVVRGGDIYNRKTQRKLRKTMNGGAIGVWFGKKFITKKVLLTLLKKPEKYKQPF